MSARYARKLNEIEPFKVMKLLARANELQEMGRPIVHMEVGEPDFPTPRAITLAGAEALKSGYTKYTPAEGIVALREKLSRHYQLRYGVDISADRICITAGGSGALLLATALTMNAGDGMLMTDPGYPCYRHFLKSLDAQAHLVPVSAEQGYQLSSELIDSYWQESTRGVVLASPANPTGAVIESHEMKRIVDRAQMREGHVIVDEIYHGLYYGEGTEGSPTLSTALDISDNLIVVNSFSKYFGMTGWRLGWLVVPEDAIPLVEKLAQNLFICASSIAQQAALHAFSEEALVEMEANRLEFRKRRDYLVGELRKLGFDVPLVPAGAFYVYAGIPEGLESSEAFCSRLLEEHDIAITPGTDFGLFKADQHVRFSYAQNLDVLREGMDKLKRALE